MPLAVGTGLLTTPQDPGARRPTVPYAMPTLRWVDPTGVEWPLTDTTRVEAGGPGLFVPSPGPTGMWDAPGYDIAVDKSERGGTILRHAQPKERLITLPLYVEGTSFGDLNDRWRAAGHAFVSTLRAGPGMVVVTRPDGTERGILAYYQDGWKSTPELGTRWDAAVLTLYCPDGHWRGLDPVPILRRGGNGGRSFLKRFPRVSTSQSLGATPVFNGGDVEAWPYWTITGPLGSIIARNQTRNESWTINAAGYLGRNLDVGETLTINTETGEIVGPVGPDNTDWAGAVDWTQSVLWRLDEGASDVDFVITGATSDTTVSASFYPRYEMA